MEELSMDIRFKDMIESGRKTRTARMNPKANPGDVVLIFDKPYLVTERKIYNYPRLIAETYAEEGFNSPGEFESALRQIYGDTVYSMNLYSHKFRRYDGEVWEKLNANGHDACWGCSNIFTTPDSNSGGEFHCQRGNRCIGKWSYPRREIEVPKRCECWDGDRE